MDHQHTNPSVIADDIDQITELLSLLVIVMQAENANEINNINNLMHQIHHEPEDDVVMEDVEVQQVVEVEQERRYPGRERRQPPHLRDYQT